MIRLLAFLSALPVAAWAEPPSIITDIAPIHSLVARVMDGVGTPELLLPPGADPHDFALRPSDARRLAEAELVIWVGPGLTPWLSEPLGTIASKADQIALLETGNWGALHVRETVHGEEHEEENYDHGDIDPHGWLDPRIAREWLSTIEAALVVSDPDNADAYSHNTEVAKSELVQLEASIATQLLPYADAQYLLPHDGYQYFEHRFGLAAAGAISGVDARTPGPAQIETLRDMVRNKSITCVLSDAEIGTQWVAVVTEGTDAKTAPLDASGAGLTPGPRLYFDLLKNMANSFADCLS